MKIVNKEQWEKGLKNNQEDPYGKRIYEYAEDWADLMEERINNGEKIVDIANETSAEADYDGITGFMYGVAVEILSLVWEHGEELRRWHNLKCQIGNEGEEANKSGGVLNPALLILKEKED